MPSLFDLQKMCIKYGPPLSLDKQLCRISQQKIFHFNAFIHKLNHIFNYNIRNLPSFDNTPSIHAFILQHIFFQQLKFNTTRIITYKRSNPKFWYENHQFLINNSVLMCNHSIFQIPFRIDFQ